jgi:hypothetical protein
VRSELARRFLDRNRGGRKEWPAHSEFRDMKMQPSLERALRHRDILKA